MISSILELGDELETAAVRQLKIQHRSVKVFAIKDPAGLLETAGLHDLGDAAGAQDQFREARADRDGVINQQRAQRGRSVGLG